MRIRVDNKVYSSEYELDADGSYHYSDDEFASIIGSLQANDDIEMVIIENGIVDYVDMNRPDLDEYLTSLARNAGSNANSDDVTRSDAPDAFRYMTATDLGYFAIFDDAQYQGKDRHSGLDNYCYAYTLQNLKIWGMNDIVSSLAVGYNGTRQDLCAILTVWDDADFNYGDTNRSKHRMSVIASYWNRRVSIDNLKNVKCKNSSASWNDRMSCISGHFGYWGKSMLDY